MKQWGKVMPAVAVACTMLAAAGCSELRGIVVDGTETARLLKGVPDIHIPASDIQGYADTASVSAGTWHDTAQSIGETHTWETIHAQPEFANESTGEPTREVVLKTACDMLFQQIQGQNVDVVADLQENLPTPGPPGQDEVEAVNNAYTVLLSDHANGDEKDKAAVSVTCYIANWEWEHGVQ